jgi:xenotropic and polytropic retrovirus receptor 1
VTLTQLADGSAELRVAEGAAVADEVMAALERNGVSFVGSKAKKKKQPQLGSARQGLQLPSTVRIDIPPTSPGRAALKVWEELVNVLRKDGADPAAAFVHRRKVQHADKNIRDAFLALYRGLELLKKFRYADALLPRLAQYIMSSCSPAVWTVVTSVASPILLRDTLNHVT